MKQVIDQLTDHYATVTDGSSALFRETLLQICEVHGITESTFCNAFAKAVAERFASGGIDADGASFAIDDLHDASDYALGGLALAVFNALEYGESSPDDIRALLNREAAHRIVAPFICVAVPLQPLTDWHVAGRLNSSVSPLMKTQGIRIAAISVFGFLAPLWWSWAASQMTYGLYVLGASPANPSKLAAWSSVLIPSSALGFTAGAVVAVISQYRPISSWLVFSISLILGSVAFAGTVSTLGGLASSPGTWAFVICALLGALFATGANNSFKPKPLRGSA